jgi:hypothetical protein
MNGVSVQTNLAEDLPPIQGDRVQPVATAPPAAWRSARRSRLRAR